jgi:SAM-dependent methyltransferase
METIAGRPEALLGWMEGLADPTRLRLLRLLEGRELGVADMKDALRLPQSTVSRHLKVLLDRGFVRSRAQGPTNLYSLAPLNGDGGSTRLWQLAKEQTEGWAAAAADSNRLQKRLEGRRRSSRAFFQGAAGQWERLREQAYGSAFLQASLLELLPPDWVVADLGCGTGGLVASLAPHVRKAIGVDQSAAMLEAARLRVASLPAAELREGSLEALPLKDGECDAALLVLVLAYVADPQPVFAEMARVVKPGGRVVVVETASHDDAEFTARMGQQHQGFAAPVLDGWLRSAGFVNTRVRGLPADPDAAGPALVLCSAVRDASIARRRVKP